MLQSIKQSLIWLCAYPAYNSATKRERLSHVAFASTIFVAILFQFICYFNYFWKNLSDDLVGSLFACLGIAAIGSLIYTSIIAVYLKYKMKTIFDNLSMIYEASKF